MLLSVRHARDGAGDAAGVVTLAAHAVDDVTVLIEIHVTRRGSRSFFPVVNEVRLAVAQLPAAVFVRGADQHETTTANVACLRVDDGQRKGHGYSCIHCVATLLQHLHTCIRCQVMDADHHGVLRADGGRCGGYLRH